MLNRELIRPGLESTLPTTFFGEPFTSLQRDMNELMESFLRGNGRTLGTTPAFAPIDVCEDAECFHLTMDVPGFAEKEIDVSLENDSTLIVSGRRQHEAEEKGRTWIRRERSQNELRRSIVLPTQIEAGKITATLSKGVLSIDAPKSRETLAKHKTIKVHAK